MGILRVFGSSSFGVWCLNRRYGEIIEVIMSDASVGRKRRPVQIRDWIIVHDFKWKKEKTVSLEIFTHK